MEALQEAISDGTAPLMYEYSGAEALKAYDLVKEQYPELLILYSGYMAPDGAMVFGCLESTFLIRYGAYTFKGLHCIVKVTVDGAIEQIEQEDYDSYAPAVMAIYEAIYQMPRVETESR